MAQSLSQKLFSRRHKALPHGQLQISVELQGVDFGAGASFLVTTFTLRGNIKLVSMCTVMFVFQHFPVNGRLGPWYPKCW